MIWTCHQMMRLQLGLLIVSAAAPHLGAAEQPRLTGEAGAPEAIDLHQAMGRF